MADNIVALIFASALLVLVPGPNVALIVASSLRHGRRVGVATVAGTTTGVALQLAIIVAGYNALLIAVAGALAWVKWAGVAVLLVLGIRAWLAPVGAPCPAAAVRTRTAFWRGTALATINPKTLLFNAAFLPQFMSGSGAVASQLPLLAAIYLAVVALGDLCWVGFAQAARGVLARSARWRQRLSGGVLIAAGGMLAVTRAGND